jgi:apolipoprotein N-acyltransferase
MINKIKPTWYLFFGIVGMVAIHMSFSVGLLAWVAYVPFLIYLNITKGIKSRLLFVLTLIIAWSAVTAKIITAPIPFLFIFLFSFPIAFFHLPGYLLWDRFKNHSWSFFLFPAMLTVMEWIQYTFTSFASWGVAAYTQANSIIMMQAVSIFGMAGLSFLIYWVNISISEILVTKKTTTLTFQIPLSVLLLLIIFGSLRYDISKSKGIETMKVAAVGTDSRVNGLPLPSKESNDSVKATLFSRTGTAAYNHAKLIVWNEGATFIVPGEEEQWNVSLKKLAAELKITLVASYVKPVSTSPFKYENKYLLIDSSGTLVYTYHKHQPVPGEPAIKGKEALKVLDLKRTKIGAVICYDYDFPYLAKGYGKLNADIVAVPSSDWRGIDPLHSKMAAFRAVEQGHSIIRSTRFGLSAAITPYGEMVAQMSSFDNNDKIMMAHLPDKKVVTVYSIIGDSFLYSCTGFIVLFLLNTAFHFRKGNVEKRIESTK